MTSDYTHYGDPRYLPAPVNPGSPLMEASQGFASPMEDPQGANVAIAAALSSSSPVPVIAPPPETVSKLPGGLTLVDGRVLTDIEVRELTGADEERISKTRGGTNLSRWVSVILECGVVAIGGEKATPALIKQLLVGDRDYALLSISKATYGQEISFPGLECPHCQNLVDITVSTEEIPVRTLADPMADSRFSVDLRKGRKAQVRLATGEDQEEILANISRTNAEHNTIMLTRCVLWITDASGVQEPLAGTSMVRDGLGIADRNMIIKKVNERQPGPRFNEVSFTHEACGKEVQVPIGIGDLFRDL